MRITDRKAVAHADGPGRGETTAHPGCAAQTMPAAPRRPGVHARLPARGPAPGRRVQRGLGGPAAGPGAGQRAVHVSLPCGPIRCSLPGNQGLGVAPGSTAADCVATRASGFGPCPQCPGAPRARDSNRRKGSLSSSATRRVRGGGRTAVIQVASGATSGTHFRDSLPVCARGHVRYPLPGLTSGARPGPLPARRACSRGLGRVTIR